MARRRMIDPNFWASEDVSKLNCVERLLLIGMFSIADDYGKGRSSPAYIRSAIFQYDDISLKDIQKMLDHISDYVKIIFYEDSGNHYYKFLNWDSWQTVQHPTASTIPEPTENITNDSRMIHEPIMNDSTKTVPNIKEVNIKEVKVNKDKGLLNDLISGFTDNEKLIETINDYLSMRKEKKKPVTDKVLKLVFKTLKKYPDDIKIAMLEKSIINSWTDVYPLKTDMQQKSGNIFLDMLKEDEENGRN